MLVVKNNNLHQLLQRLKLEEFTLCDHLLWVTLLKQGETEKWKISDWVMEEPISSED